MKTSPSENSIHSQGTAVKLNLCAYFISRTAVCLPTIPSLTICINIAQNTHIMLTNINFCGEAQTHSISVMHPHETHCSVCSSFSHCLYLKHNEFCAQSLSISVSLSLLLSLFPSLYKNRGMKSSQMVAQT